MAKSRIEEQAKAAYTGAGRYKLLTDKDLDAMSHVEYLVKGIVPRTGIAGWFGPSGSGKTFVAVDFAASASEGLPWFGYRTHKTRGLYLGLEGEAGIAQRVKARRQKHGTCPGLRYSFAPFDIRNSHDRTALVESMRADGLVDGFLIIDTLNRAAPGMDENSSQDMGEVIAGAKELQTELGGLVLLVHHTGKDTTRGLRGHSSLLAALDCAIEVSRDENSRSWRVYKAKDGIDGKSHKFKLDVVELGVDEDGDAITSCIVVPEDDHPERRTTAKAPAGGNQRIVHDKLGELLRSSAHFGKGEAPPSRPCVQLEDAISAVAPCLVADSKHKRDRAKEAITGLINRKCLAHYEGWLWTP